MPRGFFILQFEITNHAEYKRYRELAQGVVVAAGGRTIVGWESKRNTVEGGWSPEGFFVCEFPSYEEAETFYNSEAYQRASIHRRAGTLSKALLVEEK